MPMPVDKTQVCNMALSLIKCDPITNVETGKDDISRLCNLWYDPSRKEALRLHVWNFAKKRAIITRCATAPAFGYSDKYELPGDFVRLRTIGEDLDDMAGVDYEIEQDKYLLIDNDGGTSMYITYIFDETCVAKFDALFLKAFSCLLAVNLSYGIAGKETLRTGVTNMYDRAMMSARAVNGQDRPPTRVTRSKVIGARRQYSSGIGYQGDPSRIP